MISLMDVVFLLLVVFIYSMLSMSVHHGMPVKLPVSSSAEPDKTLVLSVTAKADNRIYVDEEEVDIENLASYLKMKSAGQKEPGVLLFADKALSYQDLFHVLDRIKTAGLSNISLQADLPNDE